MYRRDRPLAPAVGYQAALAGNGKHNLPNDNHNERFSDLGSVRRTGSDRPQQQSQTQPQPQPQPQRPSKPQPKSPPKPPPKPSGEPSIPGVS
ncbi:hypothetical protein CLAIMM_01673 isoform 2 [Cladophialophora immunda]|nr:hypothetical protein CLAIMM_01673 isoform 2 [Cladophialophora immunda]